MIKKLRSVIRKIPAMAYVVLLVVGGLNGCDSSTGPKTGSLTVNVLGLPSDIAAAITITGPAGPALTATTTRTFEDLPPGKYQLTAANAASDRSTFAPVNVTSVFEVTAGKTPTQATVNYAVITGIASISISGTPSPPTVVVTGGSFSRTLNASGEIGNLVPGVYSIAAVNLDADETYAATVTPAVLNITASVTPVTATVAYVPITGSISVASAGLPAGAQPIWDITGPGTYQRTLTGNGTQVLSRVPPGTYTVSGRVISYNGESYGAQTPAVSIAVIAGRISPVSFTYIVRPQTFDMSIDNVYINQSVQRWDGLIPLVAGRDAYLRVFVRGNEANTATPRVRVRLVRGGIVVATVYMNAPGGGVPTISSESEESDAWNAVLSGTLIQPGTSILADVDPDNAFRETNKDNNQFPLSGVGKSLDVRAVPSLDVRFVSVVTGVNGLAGDASLSRTNELLDMTLRMYPLATYTADTRAAFTTYAPLLQSDDANHAWSQILGEINALRVAEGSSRHYIGVIKVPYSSGVYGLGYVPGLATLNGDYPGSSGIIAHELGHNWGRLHAPCGGPANPDPQYPYSGAVTGVTGYDLVTRVIKSASLRDLMSYCSPVWISDYTYNNVMMYRSVNFASAGSSSSGSSLIVWGRIEGAEIVLEPAFQIDAPSQLPPARGNYSIAGTAADGTRLFGISFDPVQVGDAGNSRHFAFAIPMTEATMGRLARITVTGEGRRAEAAGTGAFATPTPASVSVTKAGPDDVTLTWNAAAYPMLVVRDPGTHQILAFARGGKSTIRTRRTSLDVILTDRVKSRRIPVAVKQ